MEYLTPLSNSFGWDLTTVIMNCVGMMIIVNVILIFALVQKKNSV